MDVGAIIEVAIGILLVWIVLSLTTIQIQEWISSWLDKRAKDMESAIREMLANPNLKAQFYDHPVIRGLNAKKRQEQTYRPAWFNKVPILHRFAREKIKLPSYIPSQQFALALFDIAMTADTESSLIQHGILKIRDDLKNDSKLTVHQAVFEELGLLAELARSAAATEAGTAFTNKSVDLLRKEAEQFIENFYRKHPGIKLDDRVVRKLTEDMDNALREAVRLKVEMDKVVSQQPKDDINSALSKVRRGVAALTVLSPEVNQTLTTLLMNVEEYATEKERLLARARSNVEKWFDDSMDRASGVYKRYSQNLALVIGIFLALILNVDSINLTIYLWRDPSVREALAAQAQTFTLDEQQLKTDPEQAIQDFSAQFVGISLPIGWMINDGEVPAYQDPNCRLFPAENEAFGIPVFVSTKCIAPAQPNNESNLLLKLAGIFITALAARQGAPFWFDILKRVVNFRATGANPAEKEAK